MNKAICKIGGCESIVHGQGYCNKHYRRLRKHGDPHYVFIKQACIIPGCGRPVFGHGWCRMHYQRWRKHRDPLKRLKGHERHGLRKIPEYDVWHAIKDRCLSPSNKYYRRYGGRGIRICERWRQSFLAFYTDMGPRPFPGAEIDRINNDGNYEPTNCRWVTREENQRNRPRISRDAHGNWVRIPVVDPLRYLEAAR